MEVITKRERSDKVKARAKIIIEISRGNTKVRDMRCIQRKEISERKARDHLKAMVEEGLLKKDQNPMAVEGVRNTNVAVYSIDAHSPYSLARIYETVSKGSPRDYQHLTESSVFRFQVHQILFFYSELLEKEGSPLNVTMALNLIASEELDGKTFLDGMFKAVIFFPGSAHLFFSTLKDYGKIEGADIYSCMSLLLEAKGKKVLMEDARTLFIRTLGEVSFDKTLLPDSYARALLFVEWTDLQYLARQSYQTKREQLRGG